VIERFLVPFECWSMLDYGLFGDEGNAKKLSIIDNEAKAKAKAKAKALLRLLDLTIGPSDGAVIPYDLTDALDQIRSVAPHLVDSPTYKAALDCGTALTMINHRLCGRICYAASLLTITFHMSSTMRAPFHAGAALPIRDDLDRRNLW
jgi:hypothetical protein